MTQQAHIQKFSNFIKWCCIISIFVSIISTIVFWIFVNTITQERALPIEEQPNGFLWRSLLGPATNTPLSALIPRNLTPSSQIHGFLISLLPLGVDLYILWVLIQLFSLYQQGIIFTRKNVSCYRNLGHALIARACAAFVYQPILSFFLSFRNPPGHRFVSVGFGSDMCSCIAIGIMILVISWVMDSAYQMEQEQQLTV